MAEFNVHHDVHQLMKLFGYQGENSVEGLAEEDITELFTRSTNSSNRPTSAIFIRKLESHKTNEFKKLYDDLKSRNVMELDPVMNVMARISDDPDLKHFVRVHKAVYAKTTPSATSGSMARLTERNGQDPVPPNVLSSSQPHLNIIQNATSSSNITIPPAPASSSSTQSINILDDMSGHQYKYSTPKPKVNPSDPQPIVTLPESPYPIHRGPQAGSSTTIEPSHITSNETIATASSTVVHRTQKGGNNEDKRLKRKSRRFNKKDWSFLSFDYTSIDWTKESPVIPLCSLSIYHQENALIQDLLHVLVGIEGNYIRLHPYRDNHHKNILLVDDGADKLLKTLASRIINICPMYSSVIHFIDENDVGLVNQALAASMRGVIKDFFTLMAQLESQFRRNNLTMQKMWYYLQPFYTNLEILKHFSSTINHTSVYGGAVLSILHNKSVSFTGNLKALDFCLRITRDASVPYFEMFDRWLTEGVIHDPYNEFFVEDSSNPTDVMTICYQDDSYWENRYRVNTSKMPVFLARFQEKILNTGKYLSVIRDCGREFDHNPFPEVTTYSMEEKSYISRIESSYQLASHQLLSLLIEGLDLVGHLNSVKHYFFMDQGDFIVQFMDSAEDELTKDIDDCNPTRLSTLLELSLRTSIMKSDPHHEEVTIQLMEDSLLTQLSMIISMGKEGSMVYEAEKTLKGYESIALTYAVKWPLSLILSRKNIACYQMLFRHLFLCKYVEKQLSSTWTDYKMGNRGGIKMTGMAEAFALRQKMLNFVQNLGYYMMVEVIEPNFHSFMSRVNNQSHMDELAREHTHFVEGCLKDCMLTQKFALQSMVQLLQLCIAFADFMKENAKVSDAKKEEVKSTKKKETLESIKETACDGDHDFEEQTKLYHEEFNITLLNFLEEIANRQQDHFSGNILHILNRLDYNEFYARMRDEGENPDY